MSKSVDKYINDNKNWHKELETLRALLQQTELLEEVKWGIPVYTIEGKNIVGIAAFKEYVGLWFYQGVLLKDKKKLLINAQEGKTKVMRQWRFNSDDEIPGELVLSYIGEATENQKQGKEIKRAKPQSIEMPNELLRLLETDKPLLQAFNQITPYKQKEFAEYILEAKRETTKVDRLEKIKPMILAGIGLNDKYR